MKKVRTHGGLQPLPQRSFLQATPVAAACVALLWATGGAQAQQAQAGASSGSVVTVTGIRKGIEDAISVKGDQRLHGGGGVTSISSSFQAARCARDVASCRTSSSVCR